MGGLSLAISVAVAAISIYFLKQYMNGPMCESKARLDGKIVVITGANTGIGKETALDLVKRGGKVYMACRSTTKCDAAAADIMKETGTDRSRVISMQLDLASTRSIRAFVNNFASRESKLDILINNAGVAWIPEYTTTEDGFETTFGVNHLGHFLLTQLLVRYMVDNPSGSRIVTLSSLGHRIVQYEHGMLNEKNYSMVTCYSFSKAANILFSRELGQRLIGTGVTTYAVHPGAIITELSRHIPFIGSNQMVVSVMSVPMWPMVKSPTHGAQTTVCCAVDEKLATETTKYYSDCAETEPSADVQSDDNAKALWDLSVSLLKLRPEDMHPLLR